MRVVISGFNLPGNVFWRADGSPLDAVQVGIQVRRDPSDLVRADAVRARWEVDLDVVARDDGFDFLGPAVDGRPADRFLYLTWGNVSDADDFEGVDLVPGWGRWALGRRER